MSTELETLVQRMHELIADVAPKLEELGVIRERVAELQQGEQKGESSTQ